MKHLASMHLFKEKDQDSFVATPVSNAFTEPNFRDGIIYTYVLPIPCALKIGFQLRDLLRAVVSFSLSPCCFPVSLAQMLASKCSFSIHPVCFSSGLDHHYLLLMLT